MKKQQGFVLVIVLALLGSLAFLALDLAERSQVSRRLSLRQIHKSKAMLSSRSGIEKAVTSLRSGGSLWDADLPFARKVIPGGEDLNRNGILNAGEDLNGNNRIDPMPLSNHNPCPSFAVPTDPLAPSADQLVIDGVARGYSWCDNRVSPTLVCSMDVHPECLDLNAGLTAGLGAEGARHLSDTGTAYSASDPSHPFNQPLRILLNSWGNVWKYRSMVRTDKTYDWTLNIDDTRNNANALIPFNQFDVFYPSERCITFGDVPLGDRIISERPPGGYQDFSKPLAVVESYVKGWTDATGLSAHPLGLWERHPPGSRIDPVTDAHIALIRNAFAAIAALHPPRQESQIYKNVACDPLLNNAGNHLSSPFDSNEYRNRLHTRIYKVPELPIDVNRAPTETIAALVYAARGIQYNEYTPSAINPRINILKTVTPGANSSGAAVTPAENAHPIADNPMSYNGSTLFSMTDALRLAEDICSRRHSVPFRSYADLDRYILGWDKAYDGRRGQTNPADNLRFHDKCSLYVDTFHGWVRQRLLAHLLKPHLNSNHFAG